jgi:NAD(P)-dependent dehydrogenase (short-subunit alcohol dehydrogenase family)
MQNKVVVITGASDGIGSVVARELNDKGATVVIIGRSPEKTKAVAEDLGADYYLADFTKLDEVRQLALKLNQKYPHIDILINNAGGIFGKRELTVDGHEKTIQVNHLAHFLLTNLLINNLLVNKSIIINTSSIANDRYGNLDIADLDLNKGYSPNRAYGNAKLANILFTEELNKRYGSRGVSAVAVHPGIIATNFASNTTSIMRLIYRTPIKFFMDSPAKGAESLVWLASSIPGKDWQPGNYYDKHRLGKINQQAHKDNGLAEKLWQLSLEYTRTS